MQDLSIKTTYLLASAGWDGTGTSTWTNVQIDNNGAYGWTESACPVDPAAAPVHKWFSSTIKGNSKTYSAQCSDNWFFGSRLIGGGAPDSSVVEGFGTGKFHIYGSNITAQLPDGTSAGVITSAGAGGVRAVNAGGTSEVHIHGTGIDLIGNGSVNTIAALVSTGGTIHANQAAYNLDGKGGPVARIMNFGGHIHAPVTDVILGTVSCASQKYGA